MPNEESVTLWIHAVRQGDAVAAENLWQRYFRQLMAQARSRMANVQRTAYDEEDAAISTFHLLCTKLQDGQYPTISDRDDLWHLMLTVLIRKICRRVKYQQAAKRIDTQGNRDSTLIEDLPAATSQEISQECYELVAMLKDPNLEKIALLKFEGYTNDEIASQLNRTRRTVQRMLNLIRNIWQEELDGQSY